jgi:hypothetical protein
MIPRCEPAGAPADDRAFQPTTPRKGSSLTNLVGGDVWSGVARGAAPDWGWIRPTVATPKRQQATIYRWLKREPVSWRKRTCWTCRVDGTAWAKRRSGTSSRLTLRSLWTRTGGKQETQQRNT